jgi:hypothetical protein
MRPQENQVSRWTVLSSQHNTLTNAHPRARARTTTQAFPSGVLTNAYGHGALFRSSLGKVVEKIRIVASRAKYMLETRVTISDVAKDDTNDAFGPLTGAHQRAWDSSISPHHLHTPSSSDISSSSIILPSSLSSMLFCAAPLTCRQCCSRFDALLRRTVNLSTMLFSL